MPCLSNVLLIAGCGSLLAARSGVGENEAAPADDVLLQELRHSRSLTAVSEMAQAGGQNPATAPREWRLSHSGWACPSKHTIFLKVVSEVKDCFEAMVAVHDKFAVITVLPDTSLSCSRASSCDDRAASPTSIVFERSPEQWPLHLWKQACSEGTVMTTLTEDALVCQMEAQQRGLLFYSWHSSGVCSVHRTCDKSYASVGGADWMTYAQPALWSNKKKNNRCSLADEALPGELWQCQRAALTGGYNAFWHDGATCYMARGCELKSRVPASDGVTLYLADRNPTASPENLVMSTMHIYSPQHRHMATRVDILSEVSDEISDLGANIIKLRLDRDSCETYDLADPGTCQDWGASLKDLSSHPKMHSVFNTPNFQWYVLSLGSNSTYPNPLDARWSDQDYAKERQEVEEWAVHMMETYSGTGKVFLAGNWDGDMMLRNASGCSGADCSLTQEAKERMKRWAQARQEGIAAARSKARARNVTVLFYIEFNQDERMVSGAAGVINSVVAKMSPKPDCLSYISYSTTARMNEDDAYEEKYSAFMNVMSHAESVLAPMDNAPQAIKALGWKKRVFVGEYGTFPILFAGTAQQQKGAGPTNTENMKHFARQVYAALTWGAPMVLYHQLYQPANAQVGVFTRPLIEEPSNQGMLPWTSVPERNVLWHAHRKFLTGVRNVSRSKRLDWAVDYWAPLFPFCEYTQFDDWMPPETFEGYTYPQPSTKERCCEVCTIDPTCVSSVHFVATSSGEATCYLFYTEPSHEATASVGTAWKCMKKSNTRRPRPAITNVSCDDAPKTTT